MGYSVEFHEGVFDLPFAPEVGEVRFGVRVGDADVDDAADAGVPGGLEHDLGLLHALLVGPSSVVDPFPVGIEEGIGPLEALPESQWPFEIERAESHLVTEGVGSFGVAGDGLD